MPGDFLPMLRQTNVLPRNRAQDRPFGMPEIDSGGIGTMMREVLPTTSVLADDDLRRKKDLLQFEASLDSDRGSYRGGGPSRGRGINPRAMQMRRPQTVGGDYQMPKNVVAGEGAAGMSPIQKMWRAEEVNKQKQGFEREQLGSELTGRYRQAMDTQGLQNQGWMDRENLSNQGRLQQEQLSGDMRSDLEKYKAQQAAAAAKTGHQYKLTEDERREQARTKGDIAVNVAKGPTAGQTLNPKEQNEAIDLRTRQLRIKYPQLAEAVQNVDGVITIDDSRFSDPRQGPWLRAFLLGENPPPLAPQSSTSQPARRKGGNPNPGMSNRPVDRNR